MESSLGRIFKIILLIAFLAATIWLLVILKTIIGLLLLSAVIAYILDPVASYMEFRGLTRTQSVILIFLTMASFLSVFSFFLAPTLLNELTYLQEGIGGAQASEILNKLEKTIFETIPMLSGQELHLYQQLQIALKSMADSFFLILVDIVSIVSSVIIVPFAVFFILKDGRKIKKNIVSLIPNKYFEMSLNLFHKVDLQLGSYLRGIFLDAMIIGLLAIAALWLLDIKYYVLIGIFAGLANMIPYVGPLAGMIVASSTILLNDGSPQSILWVLIAFGIIQLIDNVLVQPLVLARSVDLHPLVIIFAIIAAGQFFGIVGMLVAIPVTGIIKVVSIELYKSFKRFNLI
ncbi:MAG: AI-2E family transporter [Calditrichaeota bacterium]|nr:AI-2E family transporter [Calditrichota bacterium]